MKHYFSDGTWFDEHTEAFPVTEIWGENGEESGIFRGKRHEQWDEEMCRLDEFIIEDDEYGDKWGIL